MDERGPPPGDELHRLLSEALGGEVFESADDLLDRAKIEAVAARVVGNLKMHMDTLWPTLPIDYKIIIQRVSADEGVREDDDAFKQFAAEWLAQLQFILEIGAHFNLQFIQQFSAKQPDCFIALTHQGSLLTGTPPKRRWGFGKLVRHIEYMRIPSRRGKWKGTTSFNTNIKTLRIGEEARLTNGKLQTSPLQHILLLPAGRAGELERVTEVVVTSVSSICGEQMPRDPEKGF